MLVFVFFKNGFRTFYFRTIFKHFWLDIISLIFCDWLPAYVKHKRKLDSNRVFHFFKSDANC